MLEKKRSKKNLLVLPGWNGSKQTWKDFVAYIEADFNTVFILDLPCFGAEPCPTTVWGIEEYAEFVKKKIEQLSLSSLIILGHSFGGQVATYLVATNPTICEGLILSGAAVIRPRRSLRNMSINLIAKSGKSILKIPFFRHLESVSQNLFYRLIDSPDYLQTDGVQKEIFKKIIRQDISHLLPRIEMKTLVVWGSQDSYVPIRFGKRIARALPNGKLTTIPGGTHGLHIGKKQALRAAILAYTSS